MRFSERFEPNGNMGLEKTLPSPKILSPAGR
jgi:hypothetical protein